MKKEDKDRAIAAALTFLVTLVLLLVLFFGGISFDRQELAESSTPELLPPEEELFIEPELVDLGEETSVNHNTKPAPSLKGEPEPAPEDHAEIVDPGEKPDPVVKPVQKEITQKKESPVQKEEPSITDKERQKATSSVANKFAPKNGQTEGSDKGTSGAGGDGVGVSGNAHGRTFISCPKPDVALRHKTIVTVNVVIDAEGKVIEASATGSADATIRRKCEAAARQARWSAKKGASTTRGSITFTITPR
ncbi:MAG: hypothetical protein HDS35_11595 [Bacteroides sp.]|nr:hypothetical protein [Bacteroides sp.]MBD5281164.1 hypothetical protein [Bacteroides sp.]